ncbi:MAG: AAA family ATPase [Pseudomonadota bacterium]
MAKDDMKPWLQDRVFDAMGRPETYPDPPRSVSSRETHISKVFIAGQRVYKIKKALDLGFLDYTTLDRRQHFCQEEVRLNRRLSQGVYLGVVPITDDGGRLAIDGTGTPVEAAVCMRRLPESRCFLRMLHAGRITEAHIRELTRVLCGFFSGAATDSCISTSGSPDRIRRNCEENFEQLAPFAGPFLDAADLSRIRESTLVHLSRRQPLFNHRMASGRIREGHGDLRTGHIYFDEGIQIIDCIEFDARYRCADVAADVAFIAMDLDAEGFSTFGKSIVAAVAEGIDDPGMLALMPFYQCYRAMVRIKVSCLQRVQVGRHGNAEARLSRAIARLMTLAAGYAARMMPPELWVVCGLPGSGKSTVADALGRALALPVLKSDAIRKEIAGIAPQASAVAPFAAGIYSPEMTAGTYDQLVLRAENTLQSSGGVILDATFGSAAQRERVMHMAAARSAALCFIHCTAPAAILTDRLASRHDGPSLSDARPRHLPRFMERFEPLGPDARAGYTCIDTTRPVSGNLVRVLSEWFLPTGI